MSFLGFQASALSSSDMSSFEDALIISGIVLAVLALLVTVRFLVNFLLDVCLLNPRTLPGAEAAVEVVSVSTSPCNLPLDVKRQILEALTKDLEPRDMALLREKHSTCSLPVDEQEDGEISDKVMCAICLHELTQGQTVLMPKCLHVFHKDCIREWFFDFGTCPYCRAQLITDH
jgi:hypothetical protein